MYITQEQPPPIADEARAERAIELFLAGYDPLLFAAELGLTPEQVNAQIRWTLSLYIARAARLGRKGTGRKRIKQRCFCGKLPATESSASKRHTPERCPKRKPKTAADARQ